MESVRFGVRGRGRGDRVICTVKRTCKNGPGEREREGEKTIYAGLNCRAGSI